MFKESIMGMDGCPKGENQEAKKEIGIQCKMKLRKREYNSMESVGERERTSNLWVTFWDNNSPLERQTRKTTTRTEREHQEIPDPGEKRQTIEEERQMNGD